MCNLYSLIRGQAAIRELTHAVVDQTGDLPPMPCILPDYPAPIVRHGAEGRVLTYARWGMPSSQRALLDAAKRRAERLWKRGEDVELSKLIETEPDSGCTNIRDVESRHWKRWLGIEHRCLVPFTSFSRYERGEDGKPIPVWFALSEDRPLGVFAGIWTIWSSVRKANIGWEENLDLFAFLNSAPDFSGTPSLSEAAPIILTTSEEIDVWMRADWHEAKALRRPQYRHQLQVVRRGAHLDRNGVA